MKNSDHATALRVWRPSVSCNTGSANAAALPLPTIKQNISAENSGERPLYSSVVRASRQGSPEKGSACAACPKSWARLWYSCSSGSNARARALDFR